MSKRFRQRREQGINAIAGTTDEVANHEAVDTQVQYDYDYQDGTTSYAGGFPVQREKIHREASGRPSGSINSNANVHDDIDWEVGGVQGRVDSVPYSVGVVSSDLVENFALTGQQAVIRRQQNPGGNVGPVGTSDPNMILALAYEQAANQYYPNEASQYDLVKSV